LRLDFATGDVFCQSHFFWKKIFSPLFIGVSEDLGLAIIFPYFSVAKSHSTFAAQFRIKFMIAEVVKAAASRTTLITIKKTKVECEQRKK
jgi:hypothetical protein